MKNVPNISDAEWEVMKVLWTKAPCTANEVIEVLEDQTDWKPKTVRTLLNRLTQKKAISYSQENRVYAYYPLVSEHECVKSETDSFLKRIYGGAFKPLLVNFLKEEQFSAEDIKELKNILDEKTK
ncbi:penicillinase repressor BlaI [Paenibacillus macquariensis]|uniref:BlaI family transcriptional regulator, penicillinase repressor n=1 Tax=Paenibacillus macquariensis TaxID=948756 RepID=A0ABY1JR61_9BACL|nr:penicillinase repressor BlaI [Paenibacillus macquariensis]MEC0092713.1 penicillinase repressor BlaI [Paenibacillus macquariensis]OAB36107.1 transcriptional regulator [Paenibacillus macquariensis subsp. macquariensis]SIQ64464.1 BlaI family transcriptional regulator, penicillinase repressor [Paenibacillus macquariensis]